jgi:transcriptional regulator with XRE-family HTH domain
METRKAKESVAFGMAVREARQALGLSQEAFADTSSLHRTYIGAVERGERNPTLVTIWRIAEALQTSPEMLVARANSILKRNLDT